MFRTTGFSFGPLTSAALLALSIVAPPANGQVIRPGDVIAVSETVSAETLRVYDGCSGALRRTFNDPNWTTTGNGRYVDVAPDGTIWVGNRGTNELFQYDSNLNCMKKVSAPCGNGLDFSFDSMGRIVMCTSLPNGIGTFDPNGSGLAVCAPVSWGLWGLDVMANGSVCLSPHQEPGIRIVDPATGGLQRFIDCGGTLGRSWSLDALQSGLIIVNEWSSNRIRAVDPAQPPGSECLWWIDLNATAYPYASGMSVNESLGRIYVAVFRNGRYWLEQYDLQTHVLLSSTDMTNPAGSTDWVPHTLVVVPGGTCDSIVPFCFGDGTGTQCPCFNNGRMGHGCDTYIGTGGGLLDATGIASVSNDTLRLEATSLRPTPPVLFFQANSEAYWMGSVGTPFGNGLRCITSGTIRLGTVQAASGTASFGNPPSIALLGQVPPSGSIKLYQAWYRDPPAMCPQGGPWNLTNALRVTWTP